MSLPSKQVTMFFVCFIRDFCVDHVLKIFQCHSFMGVIGYEIGYKNNICFNTSFRLSVDIDWYLDFQDGYDQNPNINEIVE